MKKCNLVTLFFVFFSFLQLESANLISLTAKQAVGGALQTSSLNDDAVYFPTTSPVNDRIVWSLPSVLPAGIYQLDIDFYQAKGASLSTNEYISFETVSATQLAYLDFFQLSIGSAVTSTKSIGFYSPNALTSIALIKSAQNNLPTCAIRSIRISNCTETSMASLQFVFQLPITGTQITSPIPLPVGLYLLKSAINC